MCGHNQNVGAGLLANAVSYSTSLLTEPPHSRASPLPHLIFFAVPNRTSPRHECRRPVMATSLWPFA
ncbi:hypothetical protein EAH78_21920 [Pseudomonas arsenicoxydans]|uniref:Uncharacterized protein n=1 Tax=Pseudomonas arsenicoxydans TaxID=702115 RepID=A0A502HME6_9PSED|nr:hypothetical protein EAH78_21920 [Pseudomonas arsenicoxydans]